MRLLPDFNAKIDFLRYFDFRLIVSKHGKSLLLTSPSHKALRPEYILWYVHEIIKANYMSQYSVILLEIVLEISLKS